MFHVLKDSTNDDASKNQFCQVCEYFCITQILLTVLSIGLCSFFGLYKLFIQLHVGRLRPLTSRTHRQGQCKLRVKTN